MTESVLSEMRGLLRGPSNRHLEKWKAEGRPAVGYLCHYVPSEIIWAAGALPVRLRGAGSEDSALGDALMSERVCTYVRHVVSLALAGGYDLLDAVVASNTCDHVRRSADVFRKKTQLGYVGFVSVPRSPRESLFSYYREELVRLYRELGALFGSAADDDALRQAIRTMNAVRERLDTINRWRAADPPKLSGAEALTVHIAAQLLPPELFIGMADRLLEELSARAPLEPPRARLMLIGAELDEPRYVEAIESQGAVVVADRLCFGARSVLEGIDPDAAEPLDAIARAYFFRPSCARMIGDFPARWRAIEELFEEARVDGIVFERLMFCDPWGADLHNLSRRTDAAGVPFLSLTREYGIVPTGQLRTRVQAFVERLELAKLRRGA